MSPVFDVTVDSYADAVEWCHAKGWTDGLPVVPPTEALVARFTDASGWSPDDVLLREPVRGVEVTAGAVVVNCVLAGCLPEHLPVVGAVLRAMDHPDFRVHIAVSSTGGPAPVVIVNGPIRDELGMNGSGNLFGPGNRANSSIGRAVRMILRNCMGALPGVLDQATQGWFGKFSGCFPEREDASPWEPLHVRRGFDAATSTVTVLAAESSHCVLTRSGVSAEMILVNAVDVLRCLGSHSDGQGYLVLSPEHARILADEAWTVPAIQEHLFDGSRRTLAELKRGGRLDLPIVDGDETRTRPRRECRPTSSSRSEARMRGAARRGSPVGAAAARASPLPRRRVPATARSSRRCPGRLTHPASATTTGQPRDHDAVGLAARSP